MRRGLTSWLQDSKFSRHLIYPSVVFRDNRQQGNFVSDLVRGMADGAGGPSVGRCVVYNDKGARAPFVDTAVYSKNRNFRLYLSSKLNKKVPLVLAGDSVLAGPTCDRDLLCASLICNVPDGCQGLAFGPSAAPATGGTRDTGGTADTPPTCGHKASPFPTVDAFVATIASVQGVAAGVRRQVLWPLLTPPHISLSLSLSHTHTHIHTHLQHAVPRQTAASPGHEM